MKLILDSHQEVFYKLSREHIKLDENSGNITPEMCHEWIKDYSISTNYGSGFKYSDIM